MNRGFSLKQNGALSRSLAANSMVLLKNTKNTLPLLGSAEAPVEVALFGIGQIYTVKGGTGSGNVNTGRTTPVLDAFTACPSLAVDQELAKKYRAWAMGHPNMCVEKGMEPKGYFNEEPPADGLDIPACGARNDVAVIVLTRLAGEGADMRAEQGMIALTNGERQLLTAVTAAFEQTVLLLNTPGYLEITDFVPALSAIFFMGLPGQDAGAAVDVLTGAVLPSGHLTDTWPRHYCQFPTAETVSELHPNGNVNTVMGQTQEQIEVRYTDDIFVGYRYFDTFGEEVLYPFGFGLTYGKTELTAYAVAVDSGQVTVAATVANTGTVFATRQVVEVYVSAPEGALEQPLQTLRAFAKTRELQPGEEETVQLSFPLADMASFDEEKQAFSLEAGYYYLRVGVSARDTAVAGALYLPQTVRTYAVSDRMGRVPEDFKPLSHRGVAAYTYPGEAEELAYAKAHAIRLSPRNMRTEKARYQPEPLCAVRTPGLTLRDVAAGTCTLQELAASMDPEDLCSLCCGIGMDVSSMPEGATSAPDFPPPFDGVLGGMLVPGAAGETADLREKYAIPPITLADGPAGLRIRREVQDETGAVVKKQTCTAFPVGSLLACSWDREVLRAFGAGVAAEMLEYGVDLWLAPGMNLHRNPLCGRNFEYFSEDPLVSGVCAAAVTEGVQGCGVGVTVKHFAGNNQETQRTNSNDVVSQRALRELYLRGFEYVVRHAQPYAIMTSYNDINGMPSADNADLCTAIARNEWGFSGLIMTDWGGGISSPALSIVAGNDLIQPGGSSAVQALRSALDSGAPVESRGVRPYSAPLTRAALQRCAAHILGVILKCPAAKSSI